MTARDPDPQFLPTDFSHRETIGADELWADSLTDEEFDAIIAKEQAEADAWAAARANTTEARIRAATGKPVVVNEATDGGFDEREG